MTNALIVVTLVVAALTLGVAVYEVTLIRRRFQQEDTAELVPDGFALLENPRRSGRMADERGRSERGRCYGVPSGVLDSGRRRQLAHAQFRP